MRQNTEPIELNETLLIGKGSNKACYVHPKNGNWCVKVLLRQDDKRVRKHILQEIKYLKKTEKLSLNSMVKYIKIERTNLGDGYVFECVRDHVAGGGEYFRKCVKKSVVLFE